MFSESRLSESIASIFKEGVAVELDTQGSDCALPDCATGTAKLVAESLTLIRWFGGLD